jgi:hypothetical protein
MRGSSHPINSGGARLRRQCQAWVLLATILAFPFKFIERQKLRRLNCSNDRPDKRLTVAAFRLSAARLSKALEIIPRLPFYVVTGSCTLARAPGGAGCGPAAFRFAK